MHERWGRLFKATFVILAITLAVDGCGKSSTGPKLTYEVSGTVEEPGAGTVEGAEVVLQSDGPLPDGFYLYSETNSDSAGRFHFGPLKAGAYAVAARHEGRAVAVRFSIPLPALDRLSLTLQPAGRLIGTARYADATRHEGIDVYPPFSIFGSPTDSAGAWEAGGVPAGTWRVVAAVFGSFDYRIDTAVVIVQAGQTTIVRPLVVERLGSVP